MRIRELRLAHDPPLSQEKLAYRADISVATLTRAESTGSVTVGTLRKIARALDVDVTDLFERRSA